MKLKKAVFYGLLITGVGLCVGGVFLPVLIPVGGAVLAGAVAVGQNISQSSQSRRQAQSNQDDSKSPPSSDNLEIDLHISHHKRRALSFTQLLNRPVKQPSVENKTNDNHSPGQNHKLRP